MTAGGLRKRTRPGTFIPRALLRDPRLSFKAKGILAHLLDRPDGWDVRSESLAEAGPDGRTAIQAGLREAAAYGYYRLERRRNRRGQNTMWTAISDEPVPGWEADYRANDGKPVVLYEQPDGSWMIRRPDGTLTPDNEDFTDPGDDDPPGPGGGETSDGDASSQVAPEAGFPSPDNPSPAGGSPEAGFPAPDSPVPENLPPKEEPMTKHRKGSSGSVDSASPHQQNRGAPPKGGRKRKKTERTPEAQERFDLADRVAKAWWELLRDQYNVTVLTTGFCGFRDMVEAALRAKCDERVIKFALMYCGVPYPHRQPFERALGEVRKGWRPPANWQPGQSYGSHRPSGPDNVHHDPTVSAEEHDWRARMFDQGVNYLAAEYPEAQGGSPR